MSSSAASANNHRFRKAFSTGVSVFTFLCAAVVISPLALIFIYLIQQGAHSLNLAFFTNLPAGPGEEGGGMANAIVGTFTVLGLAAVIGIPVGVLGGVYLSEFGNGKINWWIRFLGDILNGVPSIIWGVVVWGLTTYSLKHIPGLSGLHVFSAYSGGLALGFLMIPIVMRTTEEVLYLVPGSYREAGLALGIPRWRVTMQIVVMVALRGIITGVLVALARVAGETAPLLFTAFGNEDWNHSLNDPIQTLPVQIFKFATSPYEDQHRQAWAGALVLVTFVFIVNISVRFLTRAKK